MADLEDLDEDEMMRMAIAMSLEGHEEQVEEKEGGGKGELRKKAECRLFLPSISHHMLRG